MADVPTLLAYEACVYESAYRLVWCVHCQTWHRHGPMNGHREARCSDESSTYWKCDCDIEYAGRWGEDLKKVEAVIRNDPEALAMLREEMKHKGSDLTCVAM